MSLSDRIWWTKKSRIKAEKRLLFKDISSQVILLWYTIFSVFVSIYELKSPSPSQMFAVTMVSLSVLVLAVTLFIGNRDFKERAMLIKQCYEQLSVIYAKSQQKECDLVLLEQEYQNILSMCENHEDIDHKNAIVSEFYNKPIADRDSLSKKPNKLMITSVIVKFIFKWFILFILAIFPIILWVLLR
ncbi:SLATT domain-containing protein [Yersinia proxima]|uniref:SLATT domain-containing protein n=1 Tax=Yersinia proxima TaxID=2890316 RepID=UPI001D104B4A|nr:SLATT domain-containing protein [Yersinia proxima]